jgi:hypothetical protein
MQRLIPVIFAAALCSGCFQQIAVRSMGGIMETGFTVLNEEDDWELAEKSIPSNLILLETIIRSDPGNPKTLLLASQGYSGYALGFVEDTDPERARVLYRRGKERGLEILNRRSDLAAALPRGIDELRSALHSCSKDDAPALFWTAVAWAGEIEWSLTDPAVIADLPKVEALLQQVLTLDSTYYYGGAHFVLGTLYGSRPKMLGGDPERSIDHFRRSIALNNGHFLMASVYLARSYAVQVQDRGLFESCLTTVDTTSLNVLPAARLSNSIAKRKAHLLRAKINDFF